MTSLYDMIYEIDNNFGRIFLEQIVGTTIVGSPMSNARKHPVQYSAYTNVLPGNDDPYVGVGWTPSAAVRDLLSILEYDDIIKRLEGE